jgi:hypothetical protein
MYSSRKRTRLRRMRAEQDEVVPRQHRVDELRQDRLLVADDAGKENVAVSQHADEVPAHLFLDRDIGVPGRAERAEGGGAVHGWELLRRRMSCR